VSTKEDIIWGDFDKKVAVVSANPQAASMSQIRQYVEEPCLGRHDDPVAWWGVRAQIYHELASLAR